MHVRTVVGVCALTLLGTLSSLAAAETVTFAFEGTVTYGSPIAVPPGTKVTGQFAYDTHSPASQTYQGFASYSLPSPARITAKIAGHTVGSEALSVDVWNQYGGNVEDQVSITGTTVVMDGTTFPAGAFGFVLASAPGQNKAMHTTRLPHSYDLAKFNAGAGLTYGFLQTDGGPSGTLLQFSIQSIMKVKSTP